MPSSRKVSTVFPVCHFRRKESNFCYCVFLSFQKWITAEQDYFWGSRRLFWPFAHKHWVQVLGSASIHFYLPGSIYGCFQVEEALDLQNLTSDDSYITQYFTLDEVMVPGLWLLLQKLLTTGINMLGQRVDKRLADLENKDYVDKILAEFWLWEYVHYMEDNRQDVRDKNAFRNRLSNFVRMILLFHHHMKSFLPGPSFRPQVFLFQLKRRYRYCS